MADPVITTSFRADTDNLYDWATVLITKSNGVEVERVTTYDAGSKATSGLVITQTTTDGFVSKIVSADAGNNNTWSTIESNFVPGSKSLASKVTTYDNGTTNTETYIGGALSQTVRTGSSGQPFTSITTTYDLVNGGHTVATAQANGQTTTDVFNEAGKLVSRTQTDGASDSADWSSVETTYTTTEGVATVERTYTYDNGVTRAETLVGGKLTTVVQTDSETASWSTITEAFGADGKLTSRAKVEDDNDTIVETYAAGVLTEVTRNDVSGATA
ncbi:hypothetical protein ACOI1H_24595 [Loktanella sp. DJP18]|uniref:hypothetical protein n=1 Tax=Loktanella sp. DJP18 TaxID=3409788 RepID=UPI003BB6F57B